MSEHTPHPHHQADHTEPAASTLIDLIAGDPPVPITVWRTARTDADPHTSLPTRLAYRLVAAYSRPGEAVVDLTTDHVLAPVCAQGGRQHHRAWFTDSSSLIIGPATADLPAATETNPLTAAGEPEAGDAQDPPELVDWFGDDLTDPDLPGADTAVVRPPDDGPLDAATSLVAATWPLHEADTTAQARLAWLLAACARLLRPGGCLVLVVGIPAGTQPTLEDFGPLVAAASQAGLGYLQHIVAVEADTDGDQFVYYHATDEELLTLAHANAEQWSVAHLRVHADLLVFTPHPAPAAGSGRLRDHDGGERRG